MWSYCRLFKELDFLSSISSMGDEEERRELSEGLKDGLLLSPWSTNKELGRSSRAWEGVQDRQQQLFISPLFTQHIYMQLYVGTYGEINYCNITWLDMVSSFQETSQELGFPGEIT